MPKKKTTKRTSISLLWQLLRALPQTIFWGLRSLAVYLWAGPNTCLGLACGLLLSGQFRWIDGVVEIHGRRIAAVLNRMVIPAMAITLGHCVLAQNQASLDITRVHERVHVRQYQWWGPFFIPAYLLCSLVLKLQGRDPYRDNPFEVQAYREEKEAREHLA